MTRARAIRLAKAENKRRGKPPLCSFNLEALGWMFVERGMDEPQALLALWANGADDLEERCTPDPAGVSGAIKVEDKDRAVERLRYAAGRLELALDDDDDEQHVRTALAPLWPEFISVDPSMATKARSAARLRSGSPLYVTSAGVLSTTSGTPLKSVRSFGGPPPVS